MPIVISVTFALALLAISTVFWPNSIAPRKSVAGPPIETGSLAIDDILLSVDARSLPIQKFEDQTFVFSSAIDRSGGNLSLTTAEAR